LASLPVRRTVLKVVAGALCLWACASCRKPAAVPAGATFAVRRAPLEITVVESGSLEAAESVDIFSEVTRPAKIMSIVEEGTAITEEDVRNGKALVKFDSTSLDEGLYRHETEAESSRASYTEATEQLLIQRSENESSIRSAELEVTYARNNLRRLVGDGMAERVAKAPPADIAALLADTDLGGQTREDLRSLRSGIELARIRLKRAEEKLTYTGKLFEKQYVSKNELETDDLDRRTQQVSLKSAEEKLEIFRRYDFVRDFQRLWAAQLETQEKQVRARAVARAREAQAQAQLRSREGAYQRAKQHLEEHKRDIANCTIKATRPGFVIYQASQPWENRGPIRAGTEVNPRQTIIRFPDLSRMAVIVKVHEAQIDAVAEKQTAVIRVDAMPGRTFTGEVHRKGVIPSSDSSWMNPDLKLYNCKILIKDQDVGLRPGLTATVEILSERVENVLQVPLQSVRTDAEGRHWVYRPDGTALPVQTGKRNRISIAIDEGLSEGDILLLTAPTVAEVTETGVRP
jgi:multidrug resistance efflux pump